MDLKKTDLVEVAGRIINESGTKALSIDKLAHEMGIDPSELSPFFKNNDEIFILVLQSLENEIKKLVSGSMSLVVASEKELEALFESLNDLFGRKPYYLSIIFSSELAGKNPAIQEIMFRIKSMAKIYLIQVINHGKNEKVHKTKQPTRTLANNILGSFRLFMNEQRVIDKMIRDIEILKNTQD